MNKLETLAKIATDLTGVLKARDRYQRLLRTLRAAIPYDSAALLHLVGDALVPLATQGLAPEVMHATFSRKDHPRLDIICGSPDPVLFSSDATLPDPFDGMLTGPMGAMEHIHSCLGCPLQVRDRLVGVLVFDAIDPKAFAHLPLRYVEVIGAIAGAQLQTVELLNALEKKVELQGRLAVDLMQDIELQRGKEILGVSPAITRLRGEIELVARSDFTVLILGETGVGKELVARAIHKLSSRRGRPMLYLNCAALPDTLAESELFGHVRGAFTGAAVDRTGKFELADGGTLFLDEIGELSLEIQAKLLRTIQEGEVQRIGSEKIMTVNVRLLAATNRDLETEVAAGRFRADLYHRLNVYPLLVAPLRDRKDDIAILADFFAERTRNKLGISRVAIAPESRQLLCRYDWPGNVRELDNIISRSILKASAAVPKTFTVTIEPGHLSGDLHQSVPSAKTAGDAGLTSQIGGRLSLREQVIALQVQRIQEAVTRNGNNWAAAARDLGMNRSNLHNLATRLGLRGKMIGDVDK